jgi:LmbE family N-acetylglucosaminyl deacetylase
LHPDHRAAGQAALDAVWAAREWYLFPEQLVDDEPWRVSEIYLYWTGSPDYWEDVTESMEVRLQALEHHGSQVNGRMDRVRDRIRERTRAEGLDKGFEHAEAFKRIRL